jgi:hypothetical protein
MKYPKVAHKLPELFSLIIEIDDIIQATVSSPVPDFERYRAAKKVRRDYTRAAEKFIQRQKGGTGGALS